MENINYEKCIIVRETKKLFYTWIEIFPTVFHRKRKLEKKTVKYKYKGFPFKNTNDFQFEIATMDKNKEIDEDFEYFIEETGRFYTHKLK